MKPRNLHDIPMHKARRVDAAGNVHLLYEADWPHVRTMCGLVCLGAKVPVSAGLTCPTCKSRHQWEVKSMNAAKAQPKKRVRIRSRPNRTGKGFQS